MKLFPVVVTALVCFVCSIPARAQTVLAGLRGVVTDPSGAAVPGALVQLVGPRGQFRQATGGKGEYAFATVPGGRYMIRFIAKGFTVGEQKEFEIASQQVLDFQLAIEANAQVVNVEDEANSVSVDPTQNGGAITFGQNQLDALSDDPDIMQQQLLALAGGSSGPNGGGIYVDGFSGAQLPPKASIQEIRVNSNPYSPENEYPGGQGIQIITKPGSSTLHGGINLMYNKEALNSRSPLLAQAKRPPYKQEFMFGNLSGQLKKNKASWGLNFSKNIQVENAFIYATVLDANLNPLSVNQTLLTPRGNWNFQPRIDYAISPKHTLTASFFNGHNHADNQGAGDFGLASRAYRNHGNNNQLQISETAILSSHMVSDTRFQWYRNLNNNTGDNTTASIVVPGAFSGGGAQIGNSGTVTNNFELVSSTSYGYKAHTIRWGGRLRESMVNSTSVNNFGGTYMFQGGTGPELDASNQAIPGTAITLTALESYRRTLLFQRSGLNDAAIRALGGGTYQFSISAGQPSLAVKQFDAGLFLVDDWRARPNLTFSYGLRYEVQTNTSDLRDFAPRLAVAWNPKVRGKAGKTVLRAGVGTFYTRTALQVTQSALRFNGVTQQSFVVFNPAFFPAIPSAASLSGAKLPQQLQIVDANLVAGQTWQASVGADRQLGKLGRLSMNYNVNRGIHVQRVRDINAPLGGLFPFGDPQLRMLTESTGFSRSQQLTVTPTFNYKKLFLAGFYTLSYGRSDAEGQPADPYNLRAEWGPSIFGDTRHRVMILLSTSLPGKRLSKFSTTMQFQSQSGSPYTITSGRDLNGDSILAERPGLLAGLDATSCAGGTLIYKPAFGCFNLVPAPGTALGRNTARGPSQTNIMNFQLSRSWVLNPAKETAGKDAMVTVPGPGGTMIAVPASMIGNMGNPGGAGKRRYNVTFSINVRNPLNHPTYSTPSGDLSSPYFGVFRTLANPFGSASPTFNRQVMLQVRLNF
ncbi:MAG TPA: TonB-dependent receptor [Bryobacteraceae bacterium]|nr:TonB-dependent receptor [Bryobacteraceae bacterium]